MPVDLRTPNFNLPIVEADHVLPESRDRMEEAMLAIDTLLQSIVNQTQNPDAATLGGQDLAFVLALANAAGILPLSKGGTGGTDPASARAALGFDAAWDAKFAQALSVAPAAYDTILEIVNEIQNNDSAIAAINTVLASKAAQADVDATNATLNAMLSAVLPQGAAGGFTPPQMSTATRDALNTVDWPAGVRIYNTDTRQDELWDGVSAWGAASSGSDVASSIDFMLLWMAAANNRFLLSAGYAENLEGSNNYDPVASTNVDAAFNHRLNNDELSNQVRTFIGAGDSDIFQSWPIDNGPSAVTTFSQDGRDVWCSHTPRFASGPDYYNPQNALAAPTTSSSENYYYTAGFTAGTEAFIGFDRGASAASTPIAAIWAWGGNGGEEQILEGSDSQSSGYVEIARTAANADFHDALFILETPVTYRYLRFRMPSGHTRTNFVAYGFTAWEVSSTGELVMFSEQAAEAPATINVNVLGWLLAGAALNTDVTFSASRDGGTTWTPGTVQTALTRADGSSIFTADIDVSGQPTGTDIVVKINTANSKAMLAESIVVKWE